MNNKSQPFSIARHAALRFGLCVLAAAAAPAIAQPTGNPKGTTVPSAEGNSQKAPATRNRAAQGSNAQGAAGGETGRNEGATRQDAPAVRSGNLRTPGVGTAGGLTGRHPGDGSATGTTETNQAPPAKKR